MQNLSLYDVGSSALDDVSFVLDVAVDVVAAASPAFSETVDDDGCTDSGRDSAVSDDSTDCCCASVVIVSEAGGSSILLSDIIDGVNNQRARGKGKH